jgi:predicted lipoprotein with Yx(FWY)xxD motif
MRTLRRPSLVPVVLVALALAGGACGSSSKKASSTSSTTTEATTATTAPTTATTASAAADVVTKVDTKLGTILADANGKTLYTLTNAGKAVPCTATCTSAWPPLLAGANPPVAGKGVTGLSAVTDATGQKLVAENGVPLYRFSQDKDSGDTYGEGISSFGGTWHVVKPGATSTSSSVLSGGGGY